MAAPTDLEPITWDPAHSVGVAHGYIDEFDSVRYLAVNVVAGQTYHFIASTEDGFANIFLLDASGSLIKSGLINMSFSPVTSQTVYFEFGSAFGYPTYYDAYVSSWSANDMFSDAPTYSGKANERLIGRFEDNDFELDQANEAIGGSGDDSLRGNNIANRLNGGSGDDYLSLQGAGSVGWGGYGRDAIDASNTTGLIIAYGDEGSDTISGGQGSVEFHGGDNADLMNGGEAADTLYGDNGGDRVYGNQGTDRVYGGGGNDLLDGADGADTVSGDTGNDTIRGGADRDTISGGTGNDIVAGGTGADKLDGDADIDTLDYGASAAAVTVNLATGIGSGGDAEGDRFGGFEAVLGSASSDRLTGSAVANTLTGNAGNDILDGAAGNDTLLGGDGKDVLTGDLGRDILTGGLLADRFLFTGRKDSSPGAERDIITDFSHAEGDRIDLSAIDANNKTSANDAFKFIGTSAFSHHAGELRFAYSGSSTTIVEADIDGNGTADLQIQLTGHIVLAGGDFVL